MTLHLFERMNLLHFWAEMEQNDFHDFVMQFETKGNAFTATNSRKNLFKTTQKVLPKNEPFLRELFETIAKSKTKPTGDFDDLLSNNVVEFFPALNTPYDQLRPFVPKRYRQFCDWIEDKGSSNSDHTIVRIHENMKMSSEDTHAFLADYYGSYDVFRIQEWSGNYPVVLREGLRISKRGASRVTVDFFGTKKTTYTGSVLISSNNLSMPLGLVNPTIDTFSSVSIVLFSEIMEDNFLFGKLTYSGNNSEIHSFRIVLRKVDEIKQESYGQIEIGEEAVTYFPMVRNGAPIRGEIDSNFVVDKEWARERFREGMYNGELYREHKQHLENPSQYSIADNIRKLRSIAGT